MISLVAAIGKNRELGLGNKIPWYLPDDFRHFKELTRGHAVIMGRKTFESIGKPLPDRKNIVITRQSDYQAPGCVIAGSLEEALKIAGEGADAATEIFIIGGAEIYKLGLPFARKIYLTAVDAKVPADTFFPELDESEWQLVKIEPHAADEKHAYPFSFNVYERIEKK